MRLSLCPLMLLLFMACSQKAPKVLEEQKNEEPLAEIEFPGGIDYDFGTYYERVVKNHDFLVRNPGSVPLVINQVETACGCTQATGPEKPILKGQTDTIHVSFDGNGFVEGFWAKHIRIHANIEGGYKELRISGSYYDNTRN